MIRPLVIAVFIFLLTEVKAQRADVSKLPITVTQAKTNSPENPLIIYVSGDGGENTFSTDVVNRFAAHGYPVVLFNTLKYFWKKKDPAQAAADLEKIIAVYKSELRRNKVCLMGYSMGADVLPFMYTRMPMATQALISDIVLISPSNSTDFEVHVSSVFAKEKSDNVPAEIGKTGRQVIIVQGNDESDKLKTALLDKSKYSLLVLKGGHHYNADPDMLVNKIIESLE